MDALDPDPDHDLPEHEEGELRPGPLWRHALWTVGVTLCGLGLGWAASTFRLGPPEFGIPSAAPGSPWPLLAVCGVAGLAAAALLRVTAARIPVYGPGRVCLALVFFGTRLALAYRPEPAILGSGAAAVLLAAGAWCGYARWTHRGTTPTPTPAATASPAP
ncbi:hypothetical protein [Streptomyces sp. NPDC046712]|uniref:hypothetical protein n=1 Tax=Streptomyces sp. NPDC046712 TaxID=3154802 RepID=UPI0033E2A6CC